MTKSASRDVLCFSAALIAGGRSTRMGGDKAFLPWGPERRPLWAHQWRTLAALSPIELFISGSPSQPFPSGFAEIVYDDTPNRGPLGGVTSCLRKMDEKATHLIVLAVDMPLMTSALLSELQAHCSPKKGAVFQRGDHFEPLAAIYPRHSLSMAAAVFESANGRLQSWVAALKALGGMEIVPVPIDADSAFNNLNTPNDLP